MPTEMMQKKNSRRLVGISLGLFLSAVYLLTYRGGFHSVDEISMFAVTESLVKFGQVNTDQIAWTQWATSQAEAQGFFGRDGHVYSKKGLALSLAQAPLYWLALHLPSVGMLQLVSTLNAFITAATGLLVFMLVHRLGFSQFTGLLTALIFGVATIAFVYAKYLFSEPLAGFLLLLAAYMLLAYRQEGGLRHIFIAGLAAGAAVLARANNLFLLPVFGLYLLWIVANQRISESAHKNPSSSGAVLSPFHPVTLSPRRFVTPVLTFAVAVSLIGTILLGYNALRSGNPFQTGYDLTLFSPNIPLGLYKLLFSPLRGFFIYSPILLLSLPGWWWLRQRFPAESWLLAGLAGVTILLFSAWSSGEGLSWGSRFLVPLVPFFAICLAPVIEVSSGECQVSGGKVAGNRDAHTTLHASRFTLYALLPLSLLIQILGVAINPWVFLSQIQTEFGGEFFLENTAALYDFRYSQIAGQLQTWSLQNSDVAWWQPWGFDTLAFGLSVSMVILFGWQLWHTATGDRRPATAHFGQGDTPKARSPSGDKAGAEERIRKISPLHLHPLSLLLFGGLAVALTYFLLTRYNATDRQFGPPDDPYTRALTTVATQTMPGDQIVNVAQYHYHVPMNRFKAHIPILGLAQQSWPPPDTALPLLNQTLTGQNVWLVTVGFPPASPDNAAERWLSKNAFLAGSEWFDDVRLVRFAARPPMTTRPINATLGNEVQLMEVKLTEFLQPGQTLPVEFVWQVLKQPRADYNLFLQLLSPDGRLAAQHDSPPNGGYSPTSGWQPGQPVITRHALVIPVDLPNGEYHLIAGLYNPVTGQRLAAASKGDFVELGSIALNVQTLNVER